MGRVVKFMEKEKEDSRCQSPFYHFDFWLCNRKPSSSSSSFWSHWCILTLIFLVKLLMAVLVECLPEELLQVLWISWYDCCPQFSIFNCLDFHSLLLLVACWPIALPVFMCIKMLKMLCTHAHTHTQIFSKAVHADFFMYNTFSKPIIDLSTVKKISQIFRKLSMLLFFHNVFVVKEYIYC